MKTAFALVLMVFVLVGCSDDEDPPTLDSALVGGWYVGGSSGVAAIEFSQPTAYQGWVWVLTSSTTYCEITAEGTATTSGGIVSYARKSGEVTNTACLNLFPDIAADNTSEPYSASASGASLTLGTSDSQTIFVSIDNIDWTAIPDGETISYLEGTDNLSELSSVGRLLIHGR